MAAATTSFGDTALDALERRGGELAEAERWEDALDCFLELVAACGPPAVVAAPAGDPLEAPGVALEEAKARAHEQLAQVLLQLDRAAEAARAAEVACQARPSWSDAWLTLGRAKLNAGEFAAAAAALRRAGTLDQTLVEEAAEDLERAQRLQLEQDEVELQLDVGIRLLLQQWRDGGGGGGGDYALDEGSAPKPCSKCCADDRIATFSRQEAGTGTMVWESGIVLAKLLDFAVARGVPLDSPLCGALSGSSSAASSASVSLRGLQVVELGSGTGIAGLAAAALGARVTLTDRPPVLPLLLENCSRNAEEIARGGGEATVAALQWEAAPEAWPAAAAQGCDLVIGSDLLYSRDGGSHLDALANVLRRLCGDGSARLLLAHKSRHSTLDAKLAAVLQERCGVLLQEVPFEQHHPDYRSPSVHVYVGVAATACERGTTPTCS
eukprot:TRINITY_DN22899_c0_g1_i3.p1 TRINITY_DN22899_c0_g1~~TRINITY_DN22899_c0_g1_i3.p1  ORF type:complete len:457 (+),score=122.10 TRINITY_DN22899_c0_g1_i3:55-1371(+)